MRMLITPLEEVDSELAQIFQDICHKESNIKHLQCDKNTAICTIEEGNIIKKESFSLKIGRNDLCLCGSGKKYKKCCGHS